jgi:hypothetical protein
VFEESELAEVGDEDEAVLLEVTDGLRFGGQRVEVVVGGLDFDDATLGILEGWRLGIAAGGFGLRKEAAVGQACALTAQLRREEDGRLERLTGCVEKTRNGGVKAGLCGGRASIANCTDFSQVLRDGVGDRRHDVSMMSCLCLGRWCGLWFRTLSSPPMHHLLTNWRRIC